MKVPQSNEGLEGPPVAVAGGTIEISVGPNDHYVEIHSGGKAQRHSVQPGRRNTLPVPPVPPGTVLTIRTGEGMRRRLIYVEIIAPGP
jgi:hypothetical protein